MGTKITCKSLGNHPDDDNSWVCKELKKKKLVVSTKKGLKKLFKDPNIQFIQLEKHDIYAVSKLRLGKQYFSILEGNPVCYYYSIAHDTIAQIKTAKTYLQDSLKGEQSIYHWDKSIAFSYLFKCCFVNAISLFTSLEAFMNQCLPDYMNIEFEGKMVTKNTIQRYAPFDSKFTNIIPKITGKDFAKKYPKKVESILELKHLRDDFIHLKEYRNNSISAYDDISTKILNMSYTRLANAIKCYINYYSPKTIINYKMQKAQGITIISKEQGEDEKGKFIKTYYKGEI